MCQHMICRAFSLLLHLVRAAQCNIEEQEHYTSSSRQVNQCVVDCCHCFTKTVPLGSEHVCTALRDYKTCVVVSRASNKRTFACTNPSGNCITLTSSASFEQSQASYTDADQNKRVVLYSQHCCIRVCDALYKRRNGAIFLSAKKTAVKMSR